MVEEIGDFLEWVDGTVVGIHQFGCWFGGRDLESRDRFFHGFSSDWLGRCRFGHGFLRPCRLASGGHFRQLGRLPDRLRCGSWVGRGPDDTPLWTTWLHPSSRFICSAEGLARWAFGATE